MLQTPRLGYFLLPVLVPPLLVFLLFVVWPVLRFVSPPPMQEGLVQAEDEHLTALQRHEAFLKAQLLLAGNDSATFILDVPGRVLLITVRGIVVRTCTLEDVRVSRALQRRWRGGAWAAPAPVFTLVGTRATLPRSPRQIVEAPRDTVAAGVNPPRLPPPDTGSPFYTLYFDRGLALNVEPGSGEGRDAWSGFWLRSFTHLAGTASELGALVRGRPPVPASGVDVTLSAADARAVYRALPDEALLVLRL